MSSGTSFVMLLIFLLALLAMLAYIIMGDPFIKQDHKKILLLTILLTASTIVVSFGEYMLSVGPAESPRIFLRTLASIYGYVVRPLLIAFFYYVLADRKIRWPFWALTIVNAVIYLTALFCPLAFSISDSNNFERGPLGLTCHYITTLMLLFLLWLSLKKYSAAKKWDALIPVNNVVIIVLSVVLDLTLPARNNSPIPFLSLAIVSGCIFFYIWLHLQLEREHAQAILAQQRIQIMMSQIQPHFLYNTLTTIQSLCMTDPGKAFDVTGQFGTYLRQNLDSLNQPDLIPIEKELEHTRIYAQIETVRFPQITIHYDIRDTGFKIPPLTIQPLVENAIRHGVRIRKDGQVTVSVQKVMQKQDACHEITVSDNGKGFDVQMAEQADDSHIGIRNVRERLEKMCHGSLTIESRIDAGTLVRIRIPAGQDEDAKEISQGKGPDV